MGCNHLQCSTLPLFNKCCNRLKFFPKYLELFPLEGYALVRYLDGGSQGR